VDLLSLVSRWRPHGVLPVTLGISLWPGRCAASRWPRPIVPHR